MYDTYPCQRGGGGLQAGRERLNTGREVEQRQLGAGGRRAPPRARRGRRAGPRRASAPSRTGPRPRPGRAGRAGRREGRRREGRAPGKSRPRTRASRLSRGHVLASLTCQYVATLAVRRRGASARSDRRDSRAPGNKTAGHALYSDSSHAGRRRATPAGAAQSVRECQTDAARTGSFRATRRAGHARARRRGRGVRRDAPWQGTVNTTAAPSPPTGTTPKKSGRDRLPAAADKRATREAPTIARLS